MEKLILYYLLIINLIGAIFFYTDKSKAQRNARRIPEKTLHLFELAGAVFSVILLMYFIRHKNKKASYFLLTWLILALWLAAVYYFFFRSN